MRQLQGCVLAAPFPTGDEHFGVLESPTICEASIYPHKLKIILVNFIKTQW